MLYIYYNNSEIFESLYIQMYLNTTQQIRHKLTTQYNFTKQILQTKDW